MPFTHEEGHLSGLTWGPAEFREFISGQTKCCTHGDTIRAFNSRRVTRMEQFDEPE